MHIIEGWGTGIPRIISKCKGYGLKEPRFEEFGNGFKVTIFRKLNDSKIETSAIEGRISAIETQTSAIQQQKSAIQGKNYKEPTPTNLMTVYMKIEVNQDKV